MFHDLKACRWQIYIIVTTMVNTQAKVVVPEPGGQMIKTGGQAAGGREKRPAEVPRV